MPGSYRVTAVDRSKVGEIAITVAFTDTVNATPFNRTYKFAAEPDPVQLDTMLRAERVRLYREAVVNAAVAPAAIVNITVDPVVP